MDPLIIVDESLDSRIASELKGRGRDSVSHMDLGTTGLDDEPMLRKLAADIQRPWVLVTADDVMPAEHADAIDEIHATIATIDGEWEKCCAAHDLNLTQDQFSKEAIHRWAHIIASQQPGEIFRYTPISHTVWRARNKHERKAELKGVGKTP